MTEVVNLRYSEYNTYIGRAGYGKNGYFGNSHPIGYCDICNLTHDRDSAIAAYAVDFNKRIITDPQFKRRVLELKGVRIGCFCKPLRCHGDIIADYLNNL